MKIKKITTHAPELDGSDLPNHAPLQKEGTPHLFGFGDMVASIATPVARILRLPCIDPATNQLRLESPCAKRKAKMNQMVPNILL